ASIVLYIRGAQALGAARSQMIFATAPFIGAFVAWTVLREPWTPAQAVAFGVMAVGVYLASTGRHEHEHAHETITHTHEHAHDDGHHDHEHEGLAPGERHTHEHDHHAVTHSHVHASDLHHRHDHGKE